MEPRPPPIREVNYAPRSIALGDSNETVSTAMSEAPISLFSDLNLSEPLMRISQGNRLRISFPHSSLLHPANSCRRRHHRPGANRYRQDRRLCLADLEQDQYSTNQTTGFGFGTYPRTRDPGCRSIPEICQPYAGLPCVTDLRRPKLRSAIVGTASWRSRRRRYTGPRD